MMSYRSGRWLDDYTLAEIDSLEDKTGHHPNIYCGACKQPITILIRYKCLDCPSFDLCSACEEEHSPKHFEGKHVFAKITDSRKLGEERLNSYVKKDDDLLTKISKFFTGDQ